VDHAPAARPAGPPGSHVPAARAPADWALAAGAARYPQLTVIPVVSDDPDWTGMAGLLPDVVRQQAACEDREVFVSGPGPMVAAVLRVLARRVPAERIHYRPVAPTR
jgi:NAD(P)H-flavin reductase